MTLFVLRHCEAGTRLPGPYDAARPLSEKGRRQAAALIEALADRHFTRIISSPLRRCVESVEPLAASRHLEIELSARLEPSEPRAVLGLIAELDGSAVLLSTHGEVISHLLERLAASGLDLGEKPPMEKGSVWVLETAGGFVVSATYLGPAPAGETGQGGGRDSARRHGHERPR